jgi:hypothetical protein
VVVRGWVNAMLRMIVEMTDDAGGDTFVFLGVVCACVCRVCVCVAK